MIPIETAGTTRHPGRPENWDESRDGPIVALPIQDVDCGEKGNMMISTWALTGDELEAMLEAYKAGKQAFVRLAIYGIRHPVVQLWVE